MPIGPAGTGCCESAGEARSTEKAIIVETGILDGPRNPRNRECPQYRGTYRTHPTYCDAPPEDDEINTLFFWFLEAGGESDVASLVWPGIQHLIYAIGIASDQRQIRSRRLIRFRAALLPIP
jgi:hypothetical protein